MSEIRDKIREGIDDLPETSLPTLLAVLNELRAHPDTAVSREKLLEKIFHEDDGLLKKLAE